MTQSTIPTPELYRQIFEVDARGAALLEDLVRRFSSGAVLPKSVNESGLGAVPGIDAVLHTYHRMGQHDVVQHIVRQINKANSAEPGENDDPTEVSFAE